MTSCLRYICCVCAKAEEKTYFTLTENGSIGKTSYKQRNKRDSKQKGTWTRRSLLANHDDDGEDMAYQMKAINRHKELEELPCNVNRRDNRRMARDVFAGVQRNTSQTTIPHWMDESFVPNGRTATHLGISSVQINAKRNEIANRRSQDLTTQIYRNSSFNPGVDNEKNTIPTNDLLSKNSTQHKDTRAIPSHSDSLHDNTIPRTHTNTNRQPQAAHHRSSAVPRPLSTSAVIDKPLVFKESQSDVGVRRVIPNTPGYRRGNPIPRLEDFTGGNRPLSSGSIDVTDGRYARSNIETRPPYRQAGYPYYHDDHQADLTYASNIILKKSDVSLKRNSEPAVFSSATLTSRPQKQKLPLKTRSNPTPKHKANFTKTVESMYGYVPKIVRNVHASTALEGNQIDDFFMQRMHDRELEKFASIGGDMENEKGDREKAATAQVKAAQRSTETQGVRQNIPDNSASAVNVSAGQEPIVEQRAPSTKLVSIEKQKTLSVPFERRDLSTHKRVVTSSSTEDQVIMIDFPPNIENDKPKPIVSPLKINFHDTGGVNESDSLQTKLSISGLQINGSTDQTGSPSEIESPVEKEPLSPGRSAMDRPRITMGLARSRGTQRADSDVSRRSTQTTTSSILESAEVLY